MTSADQSGTHGGTESAGNLLSSLTSSDLARQSEQLRAQSQRRLPSIPKSTLDDWHDAVRDSAPSMTASYAAVVPLSEACIADSAPGNCCSPEQSAIEGSGLGDMLYHASDPGPRCIFGHGGADAIHLGPTNSLAAGGSSGDAIYGSSAADVILGGPGFDSIYAGPGDDRVWAGSDGAGVYGGSGADLLTGDIHVDTIYGQDGNDTIRGAGGDDLLWGDDGDDHIEGGSGADWIDGGDGNDIIRPGLGRDTVYAGAGDDRVIIAHACEIEAGETLDGASGHDTLVVPAPLDELSTTGVSVQGFETIEIDPFAAQDSPCSCSGHGSATIDDDDVTCTCDPGWSGESCETCEFPEDCFDPQHANSIANELNALAPPLASDSPLHAAYVLDFSYIAASADHLVVAVATDPVETGRSFPATDLAHPPVQFEYTLVVDRLLGSAAAPTTVNFTRWTTPGVESSHGLQIRAGTKYLFALRAEEGELTLLDAYPVKDDGIDLHTMIPRVDEIDIIVGAL